MKRSTINLFTLATLTLISQAAFGRHGDFGPGMATGAGLGFIGGMIASKATSRPQETVIIRETQPAPAPVVVSSPIPCKYIATVNGRRMTQIDLNRLANDAAEFNAQLEDANYTIEELTDALEAKAAQLKKAQAENRALKKQLDELNELRAENDQLCDANRKLNLEIRALKASK